jgi:SAM-dependent methyltransferase
VTAIDVAVDALAHARERYAAQANLRFLQADVTALDQLPDASFDLIVSLETLEHVEAQEAMVAGFARLLAPGGLLLLSSPDKRTYSDATGFRNEHHVRELYREELLALLEPHFGAIRLFGQKLLFQSAIWSLEALPLRVEATTAIGDSKQLSPGLDHEPLYFIAVCARTAAELPSANGALLSLFGDREESVYRHYEHEVRKNIQAGGVLADLERRLAQAEARAQAAEQRASLAEARAVATAPGGLWSRLFSRHGR